MLFSVFARSPDATAGQWDIVINPPAPGKALNKRVSAITAATKTDLVGRETRQ